VQRATFLCLMNRPVQPAPIYNLSGRTVRWVVPTKCGINCERRTGGYYGRQPSTRL